MEDFNDRIFLLPGEFSRLIKIDMDVGKAPNGFGMVEFYGFGREVVWPHCFQVGRGVNTLPRFRPGRVRLQAILQAVVVAIGPMMAGSITRGFVVSVEDPHQPFTNSHFLA